MPLYVGIDLHSNRSVMVAKDETGKRVWLHRVNNDLGVITRLLEPHRDELAGIAVESTFNWYWLVDGLMDAGMDVILANPAAMKQYEGLKYSDDVTDADWIAEMLRLGILPRGYIYPRHGRLVRDLLRKRSKLVRQRTQSVLGILGLISNHTGCRPKARALSGWTYDDIEEVFDKELAMSIRADLEVMHCLNDQLEEVEEAVRARAKLKPEYEVLLTMPGVGEILAMTIMYETGDIHRFPSVGNYASYCRRVDSKRMTNGKRKGSGNTRCGNKYLAWAYIEAATFAVRYNPIIQRYHQRKTAKARKRIVATGAVAHKLARACYHMLKRREAFTVERAFS